MPNMITTGARTSGGFEAAMAGRAERSWNQARCASGIRCSAGSAGRSRAR
jgi:hypothetical protein